MKNFLYLTLSVIMLTVLGSCESDSIMWDVGGAEVFIRIVDEEGNNLLDPNVKGNWVGQEFVISDDNNSEPYYVIWDKEEYYSQTRSYYPNFCGLVWSEILGYSGPYEYTLRFGEFDGEKNYHMMLTFGAVKLNSIEQFEYIHTCKWKGNKPIVKNSVKYKGKKTQGDIIELIFPRFTTDLGEK